MKGSMATHTSISIMIEIISDIREQVNPEEDSEANEVSSSYFGITASSCV